MSEDVFSPQGKTVSIAVSTTTSTPVQVTCPGVAASNYLLRNDGLVSIWITSENSSAAAVAVIPVVGTPQSAIFLAPAECIVVALGPNKWFAAIAASGTSSLYVTPGIGGGAAAGGGGSGSGTSVVLATNSTVAPLGIGAVFTGTAVDISQYTSITVVPFSDQASATNGLSIQQSSDGTNWDVSDSYSVSASTPKNIGVLAVLKFGRVVYTNGAVAQGSFRMQTIGHGLQQHGSSVKPTDGLSLENDMEQSMSVQMVATSLTTMDMQRSPVVFKTLNAVSIATEATIWTPAAGKKFRLMGFVLTSGVVGGNVLLKDGTGGTTIAVLPFGAAAVPLPSPLMGNGQLSAAANNLLTATGTATQTLSGYLFGTEE